MYIHCEGGGGKRLYKFDMISRDTPKNILTCILVLAHSSYRSFVKSIIHLTDLSTLTQSINANVTSSMSRMRSLLCPLETRKFKVIILL